MVWFNSLSLTSIRCCQVVAFPLALPFCCGGAVLRFNRLTIVHETTWSREIEESSWVACETTCQPRRDRKTYRWYRDSGQVGGEKGVGCWGSAGFVHSDSASLGNEMIPLWISFACWCGDVTVIVWNEGVSANFRYHTLENLVSVAFTHIFWRTLWLVLLCLYCNACKVIEIKNNVPQFPDGKTPKTRFYNSTTSYFRIIL